MNADYFRMLFNYNYAAHDKVWQCVMQLSDEQFTREMGYSLGSVRNQLVHVMGVDYRWIARIRGAVLPEFPRNEDYLTPAQTMIKWEEVKKNVLGYVKSLDDEEANRMVEYNMPHRGGMKQNQVFQILAHIVNHGTDHRAQILAALHQLGAPTVEQDLMIFLWG